MEVRWAYLDFQLPGVDSDARFRIGLQSIDVNPYLWKETVGGINFSSDCGTLDYQLAWMRGYEVNVVQEDDDRNDVDAFLARLNYKPEDHIKAGVFVLYQTSDADADSPAEYGSISSQDWEVK
jgi:hypothetical protein